MVNISFRTSSRDLVLGLFRGEMDTPVLTMTRAENLGLMNVWDRHDGFSAPLLAQCVRSIDSTWETWFLAVILTNYRPYHGYRIQLLFIVSRSLLQYIGIVPNRDDGVQMQNSTGNDFSKRATLPP